MADADVDPETRRDARLTTTDPEKESTRETRSPSSTSVIQGAPEAEMQLEIEGSNPPDQGKLHGVKLLSVFISLCMAGFIYSLDVTVLVAATPTITTEFKSIKDLGWYGAAYLLSVCSCVPLTGKLYSFYDLKFTFFVFLVIFELGSLLCAVAPTSTSFIIGRAVSGIGGSGLFNGALTILASVTAKEQYPQLLGITYGVSMLGTLLGPIIGGLFCQYVSWRWCFYINLPIGGLTIFILALVNIPKDPKKSAMRPSLSEAFHRLDPLGMLLFAPACIMLLLAVEWGGITYPWGSSRIIGLFVGSGATLIVFVLWERRRGDTGLIPLSILGQRTVAFCALTVAMQIGVVQCFTYYVPIWFQTILGVSPTLSGAYFMATAVPLVIGTMLAGALVGKVGHSTPFALFGNILSTIGGGLMTTWSPTTGTGHWVGYQLISGFGRGLALQHPVITVQSIVADEQMAVGTAIIIFFQFFGGAITIAMAQTDFTNSLGPALAQHAPSVPKEVIINVGSRGVRDIVTPEQLPGVLLAYNESIIHVFYLGLALAAGACFAVCGTGFKSMKADKPQIVDSPAETKEPSPAESEAHSVA